MSKNKTNNSIKNGQRKSPLTEEWIKKCDSYIQWIIVIVQSLKRVQLFVTPWTASVLGFPSQLCTISQSCLKFMSIKLVMPPSYLIICCPLLLLRSSFPASGSFPMSQSFVSGGQSIGASASA